MLGFLIEKKYRFMEMVDRAVRGAWEFQNKTETPRRSLVGRDIEVR